MICSRAYQAWTCCLFILIPWLAAAAAEINAEPIVVGVFEDPPFVMVDSRNITGMAVDIWEEALHNINTGFVYKIYDDLPALFIAVQNGEAAAAAANISATAERALRMRLTFPWYDSGLGILVADPEPASLWTALLFNGTGITSLCLCILLIAAAAGFAVLRRNADPEFPPGWLDGVTLCLRDLVAAFKEGTLDTQYPGWIGNLISVLWMAFGLGAMAFITSSMASSMMARAFAPTALIANVGDLTDRSVGVIRDAAGQRHLVSLHIGVKEYDHIDAGADALRREEIDAFVADAPVIDYWLAQNPSSGLRMVEETFLPDKFVFAVNRDHAYLADAVSAEIIRLYKSGRLADIGRRYFGPDFR